MRVYGAVHVEIILHPTDVAHRGHPVGWSRSRYTPSRSRRRPLAVNWAELTRPPRCPYHHRRHNRHDHHGRFRRCWPATGHRPLPAPAGCRSRPARRTTPPSPTRPCVTPPSLPQDIDRRLSRGRGGGGELGKGGEGGGRTGGSQAPPPTTTPRTIYGTANATQTPPADGQSPRQSFHCCPAPAFRTIAALHGLCLSSG